MRKRSLGAAAFVAAALLAGHAAAANPPVFETSYGSAILSGDDNTAGGDFGFSFHAFGDTFSHFTVSTNGFLQLGTLSNGPRCCSGSAGGLLAGEPTVAAQWFDLVDTVYLNLDTPDRAVFTWVGSEYSHGGDYVTQAQLFANGQIVFGYAGSGVPVGHVALTGVSPGHGASDPGGHDLDLGAGFSGGTSIYEVFNANTFDLNGKNVVFTPNAAGGYDVANSLPATGGVPEPAEWALMLLGFGGLGATLRRRRATAVTA